MRIGVCYKCSEKVLKSMQQKFYDNEGEKENWKIISFKFVYTSNIIKLVGLNVSEIASWFKCIRVWEHDNLLKLKTSRRFLGDDMKSIAQSRY